MIASQPAVRIVIATRQSALALWQARFVQARLAALYPHSEISILGMTTTGDRVLGTPLAKIGGKGLFVKELENALEAGIADIAVHSMKDVPMHLPDGFALAAVTDREDPRDAFVSNDYRSLAELPQGSIVGTSSLRRESQIRARFPSIRIEPLRGNVQTRLRRLDEGRFSAIILAAAGLKRLGLGDRITALIPPDESLPAAGQGALAIECRADRADLFELLHPLNHPETAACVTAERALSRALAGSCQVPLGAFAEHHNGQLRVRGFVATPDGARLVAAAVEGSATNAESLGQQLAEKLVAQGAREILAALEAYPPY